MVTSSEKMCKFKRKTVLSGEQLTWEKTPLKKRSEVDLRLKNMLHEKNCRIFFTLAARVKQK